MPEEGPIVGVRIGGRVDAGRKPRRESSRQCDRIRRMRALLISTYELGHQPFGLASPAAWLRRDDVEVQAWTRRRSG